MSDSLLLTAKEAAALLKVSRTYFEQHIRPYVASVDLRSPGAKKPMPRWSRAALEAFTTTREKKPARKSA